MEYLSDGITEAIINTLSRLPQAAGDGAEHGLPLQGATGRPQEPQEIGRALDVRAVLTGRVLHRGDMLTIGAELVDVDDGSQIWGGQFHRRLSGIFELQDEIADEMTDKLKLNGGRSKEASGQASDAGSRGVSGVSPRAVLVNKRTAESFARAIAHFEEAIAKDPGYAAAHAGLGETYALSVGIGFGVIPRAERFDARELQPPARSARRNSRRGARAGRVSQISLRLGLERRRARVQARARAESRPCAFASLLRNVLGSRGRFDEALQEMRRAQQLDPLSLVVASGIGRILHFARRFDDAIARCHHVIQMDPTFTRALFDLALTLIATGAYDEAFQELKKAGDQPFALMLTSIGQGLQGHRDSARSGIARLEEYYRAGALGTDELALVYAAIGNPGVRASFSRAPAKSARRRSPTPRWSRRWNSCAAIPSAGPSSSEQGSSRRSALNVLVRAEGASTLTVDHSAAAWSCS